LTVGDDSTSKIVYWHRELPPVDAELIGAHTLEASSNRIPGTIARRDELWHQCYEQLMAAAESRLIQEVHRLGCRFAHLHDEASEPKHDAAAGEAWLRGRFDYMLYC
jgi:hypothetical protein